MRQRSLSQLQLPHCQRQQRRQRGFTLIELLVSLTIMAVIMGLLGAGIRTVSQGWDRAAGRLETLDMLQRATSLIRRDVEGLRRLIWPGSDPARFIFAGTRAGMSFVTVEPAYPTRPGLYFVNYAQHRGRSGLVLMRARARFNARIAALEQVAFTDEVAVIEGPYRLEFSYGQAGDGGLRWSTSWAAGTGLPDLVRLDILSAANGAIPLPPLIMRPRSEAELVCVWEKAQPCSIGENDDPESAPDNKPLTAGGRK